MTEGKKPLPVLRRTSYLTLYMLCVKKISYFVKLFALARNQFLFPSPFISSYALNQFTNKAGSTLPELSFRNYHVRSQTFAVNVIYNVLFTSIQTHFLHITRKSTEKFVHSL